MANTTKQQKIDNAIDYLLSINNNIEFFIQGEGFIYADIPDFNKNEYNVFKYIMYKWLILHSTPTIFTTVDYSTITITRRELKLVDSITTRTQLFDLLCSITHKGLVTYKKETTIIETVGCKCESMVPIIAHSPIKSEITLELHPELVRSLKLLLSLQKETPEDYKNKLVYISIIDLFKLKSLLSKRLYEIISLQVEKEKFNGSLPVEDIRRLSGTADKYPSYADLKRYTIVPAIEDINENTKFNVSIDEIKSSRAVVGISFYIKLKEN